MSGARLDLAGVGKSFRGLRAVHDVSFSGSAGQVIGMVGPSGSGKSTVAKLVQRLYIPENVIAEHVSVPLPAGKPTHVGTAAVAVQRREASATAAGASR